MSLRALFWSRLALGVLSCAFFLLYTTQYAKYRDNYGHLADKYSKLMVHSDGLSAQLQLMVDRNQRTEKLLNDLRTRYAHFLKGNNEKRQNNEAQKLLCEETLKKCLADKEKKDADKHEKKAEKRLKVGEDDVKYSDRIIEYQKEMQGLKKQIEELKETARNASLINEKYRMLLSNSQITQQQQQPPTTNYVQNGKVHFSRLSHLNEELEFRRNTGAERQFPTLLPRKELLEKLRKRNERREQIPDNAAEVVDIPEVNDHDYKDYKDANCFEF